MPINKHKKQDNETLVLRFDRVDQLKKQIEDLSEIIQSADSADYIKDVRDRIVVGLVSQTEGQRTRIQTILAETGIFDLMTRKQAELVRRSRRVHEMKGGNPSSKKRKPKFKKRNAKPKTKLRLVHSQELKEPDYIEGTKRTLIYNGIRITIIEKTKVKFDKEGEEIPGSQKEIVQVVKIEDGKMPKVVEGCVYDMEHLPLALRFALIPGAEKKHRTAIADREAIKLSERKALSVSRKGSGHNKNNNKDKKGKGKGRRAA